MLRTVRRLATKAGWMVGALAREFVCSLREQLEGDTHHHPTETESQIMANQEQLNAAVAELQAAVEENTTVDRSIEALVDQMAAKLEALGNDSDSDGKVDAQVLIDFARTLRESSAQTVEKVRKNTPAEGGGDVPPVPETPVTPVPVPGEGTETPVDTGAGEAPIGGGPIPTDASAAEVERTARAAGAAATPDDTSRTKPGQL